MTSSPPATDLELPARPTPVAFCITELDPGGAERALVETVTRLDRRHWSPTVYCLGPEAALCERLRDAGIEVICFNAAARNLLKTTWMLRRDLRATRPAVLMTSLFHANFVGRLAAIRLDIPVIAGHRVAERHARWHLTLERLTGRFVTHHVAVSESVRQFLIEQRIASEATSSVIYNGVHVDRFRSAEPAQFESPGPIVLFVGRLSQQKGLEILFEAWADVIHSHPTAKLLIAGRGPLQDRVDAAVADSKGTIEQIGFQSDIAPWYARADVVVLPSRWEGLPNVLLEALASATPCVVSHVEGVQEVLGGHLEWTPPPNDPTALATALCAVLTDPQIASEATSSLQTHIEKEFTWETTARKTAELLGRHRRND